MPRFVLLYHDCPPNYQRPSHWDLMLESGEALRTWALEQLPRDWLTARSRTQQIYPECAASAECNAVVATSLGDHRRDYLNFEGPVSNDRGTVVRVAAGTYSSEVESTNYWRVTLTGDAVAGPLALVRESQNSHRPEWTLQLLPAS